MSGLDGVDVPRRNGELAFDAPWQSRAFGMAAAVVETQFGRDWGPFRSELIAAIAADEGRPYWESWTAALEELIVSTGLVSAGDIHFVAGASGDGACPASATYAPAASVTVPRMLSATRETVDGGGLGRQASRILALCDRPGSTGPRT